MGTRRMAAVLAAFGLLFVACSTNGGITVVEAPTAVSTPTVEPATPEPTASPTAEPPTPEPTGEPTAEAPTPEPTAEPPTPEPTAAPVAALGDIRDAAVVDPGGPDYVEFVDVSDESGLITVTVPVQWAEADGRPWEPGGDGVFIGSALTVAPDLTLWRDTWGTPGVFIAASDQLEVTTTDELLADNQFGGSCEFEGTRPYDDGVYAGAFDLWVNCGDAQSAFVVIAAEPEDASYLVLVEIVIVSESDWDAAATVVGSFLASIG